MGSQSRVGISHHTCSGIEYSRGKIAIFPLPNDNLSEDQEFDMYMINVILILHHLKMNKNDHHLLLNQILSFIELQKPII
jgi:hypothetical protein